MPKITVEYIDNDSVVEEIIATNKQLFGKGCKVTVSPNNDAPESWVHFGLQRLITPAQLDLMYGDEELYSENLQKLRKEVFVKLGFIVNSIIMDNEEKFR